MDECNVKFRLDTASLLQLSEESGFAGRDRGEGGFEGVYDFPPW